MKYTKILSAVAVVAALWLIVSAVLESGLPRYPLYYIASVTEIGLAFLTHRLQKAELSKRSPILPLILLVLCFATPIVLSRLNVGIIWQAGGSQLWYVVSLVMFDFVRNIRKTSPETGSSFMESASKGVVLAYLVLLPLVILAILAVILLSRCS